MIQPTVASIPEYVIAEVKISSARRNRLVTNIRAKEEYLGSSLIERTARLHTFTDIGPADLCSIHKFSPTSKKNADIGTFLYFTGVDTSSSASIGAQLQNLATLIGDKGQYWFGEKKHWKVPDLTYCAFNAFSKVDMRVKVHIPGSYETSVVNHDGKLIHDKISDDDLEALWTETFVTSMVRCLIDNDEEDPSRAGGLVEVRKVNPFTGRSDVLTLFMSGFEKLFWDGPKLGCDVDIPQPTLVSNYLVDGFLRCVHLTQNYDTALDVLGRLRDVEPAVVTIIAKVLLMKDEEVAAVQEMNAGIALNPRDSSLLLVQAQFCLDKKRYDLALSLAKQAVQASPSDFKSWGLLVTVYTKLNDFENALLTLNSCPMNSHKERYYLKRIVSLRGGNEDLHLPSPLDVVLDEVSNLSSADIAFEQKNMDPQLANLPAGNLKSTFAKAYDLLTDIVSKTGWEALLKYRAKVFVMEEEYRKDRTSRKGSTEDTSSTVAIKSPTKDEADDEFRKKRLCERWLDNLFMLLYEDLRAYTMWQAEYVHFQAQQMEYKKTTTEWEILGMIAYRLKHFKEGSQAFANALSGRFSARSTRELVRYYKMERSKSASKRDATTKSATQLDEKILECCIKLLVWNHRWYCDFSPSILITLAELVATEGLIRIQSSVQAVYSNQISNDSTSGIIEMMNDVYSFFGDYKLAGSDN
ncbi:Bud site selection protein 7 [Meyerozyma sp. JA9]|nr:Bud site selection protein 7 [Meyerozyma sp. JA9]